MLESNDIFAQSSVLTFQFLNTTNRLLTIFDLVLEGLDMRFLALAEGTL
jgi:hypothetical protein